MTVNEKRQQRVTRFIDLTVRVALKRGVNVREKIMQNEKWSGVVLWSDQNRRTDNIYREKQFVRSFVCRRTKAVENRFIHIEVNALMEINQIIRTKILASDIYPFSLIILKWSKFHLVKSKPSTESTQCLFVFSNVFSIPRSTESFS